MKVDGTNSSLQIDAYVRQTQQQQQDVKAQEQAVQQKVKTDKVQISQAALETQKAAEALKNAPDVREDKVQDIKLEVDDGRYQRPAEQVATNMLNEGFENDLLLKKIDTHA